MIKTVSLFAFLSAQVLTAQPQLGPTNLIGGSLWPKGVYALAIHDGPGPRTADIADFLADNGKVADFFQTLCHFSGQPWADTRSAMCFQQHVTPVALLNRMQASHQCIGNHGQDHLVTPTLNQPDTVYQIGGPTAFFQQHAQQPNCPDLLTFPGFQGDPQHTAWLNQDGATAGRQQGPIGADFTGNGVIGTATVSSDQDCFTQGFDQQQCQALMLGAMAQANHGGIIVIHDFNPYAYTPTSPTDLKSGYAYDYVVGIFNGCQQANGGTPCVWLTPDAIPGVHRDTVVSQFHPVSAATDDFSNRIADVLVGDINGDGLPDVLVPRADGMYCATNAGNGMMYPLAPCLNFKDTGMVSSQYWLADLDVDNLPYLIWLNDTGMVAVQADGHGGFGATPHLLSANIFADTTRSGAVYPNSVRFGPMHSGSSLPDVVAMTATGVVIARNNGHGFDAPRRVPHLSYQADGTLAWTPQQAGKSLALADLLGSGSLDILALGNSGLLYASPTKTSYTAFKPLNTKDGFQYWSNPQFYTALTPTPLAGRTALAGWTPVGIAYSNFAAVESRATVDQFQVLCSDCYATLPGWLAQWQQANMTLAPFQSGFADFKHNGTPQAFAVWGTGLFVADVGSLTGY